MYKTLIFFFILPFNLVAQVFPKEGSLLNYRLIGFSWSSLPKAKEYKVEIAKGNYNVVDSFTKNIVQTAESKDKRMIAEVPSFGAQYTWRIVYTIRKNTEYSQLYHFSALTNAHVDTTKLRLKILQPAAEQYKDYYVAIDAGGVLYDMSGSPVWFIPDTNGISGNALDLKFTPEATFTFMYKNGYEMNYNGDVLWKTPNKGTVSGDTVHGEFYHHEFTKLSNGHYMALGLQFLMCRQVDTKDTGYFVVSNSKKREPGYTPGRFGTLIEYDEKGNIVWSWKSLDHLQGTDFDYYKGMDSMIRFDPHDNAFFFDEKNKCIYLGYKFLNRIIKIEYPSGRILRVYGENFKPGMPGTGAGLFCNQHSIGRTHEGDLYIFNNNSCRLVDSLPTVVVLKEPVSPNDTFKKVWEYTCTIDEDFPKYSRKLFASGGNAIELADSCFFVCMGSEYSKMFIVNRDKKVLWSALPERYMETDQKWTPVHVYRGNIISRQDLERMIWSAENQ